MSVKVKFYLSLKEAGLPGKEMTFDVKSGISVPEFLKMLGKRYPSFKRSYLSHWLDEEKEPPLLIVKNDKPVKLGSSIEEDDYIKIFEVLSGG